MSRYYLEKILYHDNYPSVEFAECFKVTELLQSIDEVLEFCKTNNLKSDTISKDIQYEYNIIRINDTGRPYRLNYII